MDVATLPINQTPPSSAVANAPGELPADPAQPGVAQGADQFAALLAKQIGVDMKLVPALGEPVVADPAVGSDPAVDAALLQQQAALFMPVPLNVPNEIRMMPKAGAQNDAPVTSLSDQAAADVKGAASRQPVAANAAAFAVSEEGVDSSFGKILSRKSTQSDLLQVTTAPASVPTPAGFPVATATPQNNAAQPSSNIPQTVGHSAWGDMLGDRVVWMVGQQHQGVELHLNPPSLGPLEVRLSMSDGQANLSFATQHLPVKEAIESATARLREMLGESGISLGSVSVNLGSFAQQQQSDGQAQSSARLSSWPDTTSEADFSATRAVSTRLSSRNGMVDIFA